MPSKSKKQARFMAAAAHNPQFAKRVGIKQSVARDFNKADAGTGILKGPIKKAGGGLAQMMRGRLQGMNPAMGRAAPGRLQPAAPAPAARPPMGGGLMNYLRGIQQQFGGMRPPGMGQPGMMPPQQALPAPAMGMNPKAGAGDYMANANALADKYASLVQNQAPGGTQMIGGPTATPGQPLPPRAMMAYGGEFDTGDQLRGLVSRMAKGGEALSALKELAKKFYEALQTGDQNLANQLRQQMEAIQPGSTQGLPPAQPAMPPGAAPEAPGPQ